MKKDNIKKYFIKYSLEFFVIVMGVTFSFFYKISEMTLKLIQKEN